MYTIMCMNFNKINSDVHNYNTRQAHHIHSFKGNNKFI